MNNIFLKNIIGRFDCSTFENFIKYYFNHLDEGFYPLEFDEDRIYYSKLKDSYGGTIHSVYLLQYYPFFNSLKELKINYPSISEKLLRIKKRYHKQYGYWGMVSPHLKKDLKLYNLALLINSAGFVEEDYQEHVFPEFLKLVENLKIEVGNNLFIGSYDSFFDLDSKKIINSLFGYFKEYYNQIVISCEDNILKVSPSFSEIPLYSGVIGKKQSLVEPVYLYNSLSEFHLINEFEELLNKDTKESDLEKFLVSNFKLIFGEKYDRIETQLFLQLSDLSGSEENRRLDILLRDSVENDWEILELKRSKKNVKYYRNIPAFRSEVSDSIMQLKYYLKLLKTPAIKDKLYKKGIEYFEPSLRIVIGGQHQISHKDWRWLKVNSQDNIRVSTYEELKKEMEIRVRERERFLKEILTLKQVP